VTSPHVESLTVASRFNGPDGSGNGGYVAGLLAAHVPAETVQVTLREPPPLEVALYVARGEGPETGRVVASFGGAVIAAGESGTLVTDPVPPVDFATAAEAESRYQGLSAHPFPGCFVCGTDRPAGDGMALRPGRLGGERGDPDAPVATTWVPDPSLAGPDGLVAEEVVWAALDCPSGWASDLVARPMVLGRITAAVHARPEVGERCVVVGRLLGTEGRKTFTASTAYDGDGRILGRAEATWISPR
jgi:hypothetical protein